MLHHHGRNKDREMKTMAKVADLEARLRAAEAERDEALARVNAEKDAYAAAYAATSELPDCPPQKRRNSK